MQWAQDGVRLRLLHCGARSLELLAFYGREACTVRMVDDAAIPLQHRDGPVGALTHVRMDEVEEGRQLATWA